MLDISQPFAADYKTFHLEIFKVSSHRKWKINNSESIKNYDNNNNNNNNSNNNLNGNSNNKIVKIIVYY